MWLGVPEACVSGVRIGSTPPCFEDRAKQTSTSAIMDLSTWRASVYCGTFVQCVWVFRCRFGLGNLMKKLWFFAVYTERLIIMQKIADTAEVCRMLLELTEKESGFWRGSTLRVFWNAGLFEIDQPREGRREGNAWKGEPEHRSESQRDEAGATGTPESTVGETSCVEEPCSLGSAVCAALS